MTRSSKSKNNKRNNKKAPTKNEEEEKTTVVVEVEKTTVVTVETTTVQSPNDATIDAPVEETKEPEGDVNADEQTDETSRKRSRDELQNEEDNGFLNLGKVIGWLSSPVVNTLGSFFNNLLGTSAPAEPEDGPPAIDCVIPMMLLGSVGVGKAVLQKALLDSVATGGDESNMAVDEYKKDFAFETLVDETKTIHSVRLQLYDCYGVDPTDEIVKEEEARVEESENAAWQDTVKSVKTIVLVLSATKTQEETVASLGKWVTWIHQQFKDITEKPAIVLLLARTDGDAAESSPVEWMSEDLSTLNQGCQTHGIQSWHFLSPESSSEHGVPSVDDLLYSLVERSSQQLKPLSTDSLSRSTKRRKVELDAVTVAD